MTAEEIRRLCARPRKSSVAAARTRLCQKDRERIAHKTARTCHVCGGALGAKWQADHVVPHTLGGKATLDNYLPICKECNRLRWFYSPDVIRLIMRLGTYAKNEIRHRTTLGEELLSLTLKRLESSRNRRASGKMAG